MSNQVIEVVAPREPLVVSYKPIPDTPSSGLVVKVVASGICHSDVHTWEDQWKISEGVAVSIKERFAEFNWPIIMGHEVCGEVHSIGSSVPSKLDLSCGDLVAVYPWMGCGQCLDCEHGHSNICSVGVKYDLGIATPGGYQHYMAVRDVHNVQKLPTGVPAEVACMFGCSALTSYHACQRAIASVERAATIQGKAHFLIVGAGGLGLWTISIAKALFPQNTKIIVADIDEEKLKLAKQHGADETIYWPRNGDEKEHIEATKAITGGIDASVDFVGITTTLNRCFQAARKGATLCQVGLAGGSAQISLMGLALKDITVAGVYTGTRKQMTELIQLYTDKKLKPPHLTFVTPDKVSDAIMDMHKGKVTGRQILQFKEQ